MGEAAQSWASHIRATLRVGLPLVGGQLAMIGLGVTDTVMLGWLSAEALAAGVLGTSLYFVTVVAGAGFAHSVTPTVASAAGAGDEVTVRRAVRMGFWLVLGYAALAMPVLWQAEAIFLALGQEPVLAERAAAYVRIAQWALALNLIFFVLREFLSALERTRVVLVAMLGGLVLNGLVDYVLIFGKWGAPAMGLRGAAIATLGTNVLVMLVLLVYTLSVRETARYALFQRVWRGDGEMIARLFRLGWPISLTLLAEVSLFALSAVMMGWLGTIALAAHGIAIQLASVVFMVPLGLSFAATVRVGRADGRKDGENLRRAGWSVFWVAIALSLLSAALLVAFPRSLSAIFLDPANSDASQVLAQAVPLVLVAAVFQLADTSQVVGLGMLRGIKDTRVPMVIAILSYTVVGLAVSYWLGFVAGFGGVGVWFGLAIGLTLAGILLNWRFLVLSRGRHQLSGAALTRG